MIRHRLDTEESRPAHALGAGCVQEGLYSKPAADPASIAVTRVYAAAAQVPGAGSEEGAVRCGHPGRGERGARGRLLPQAAVARVHPLRERRPGAPLAPGADTGGAEALHR